MTLYLFPNKSCMHSKRHWKFSNSSLERLSIHTLLKHAVVSSSLFPLFCLRENEFQMSASGHVNFVCLSSFLFLYFPLLFFCRYRRMDLKGHTVSSGVEYCICNFRICQTFEIVLSYLIIFLHAF